VQEAWLRWAQVDESTIQHAGAYLSRLATNLCLDKLRTASAKREQYVGVLLPEPLLNDEAGWSSGPEVQAEFAQDVSVAFMLALERLSALERAAFLLHDVFDLDFDEIGRRLERSPAACLYHMAIWRESPLFTPKERAALALTEALTQIAPTGISDELYTEVREQFSERNSRRWSSA